MIDYLFKATIDDADDIETRKYDQIMHDVKSLLSSYPDYKVYVTGHSLGGALSSITSIYFACDPNLPKPITCINFGCPKVGGWKVFEAVHYLERKQKLRIVRCINKNDCVISFPLGEYWHFGLQVTCYKANQSERKSSPPLILYMNPHESAPERMAKTWNNSLVMNFNFFYDHGDYIQRIETSKAYLIRTDLTALYKDRERVGFEIMLESI
jgi:Predicted lipase